MTRALTELTQELFHKLYFDDLLTEKEIADEFGTYQVKINRLRQKWGFPTLGKTGRNERALPPLTDTQIQLITGSLLGDAWMEESSAKSARINEGHCLDQVDYLMWKAGELAPYVSNILDHRKVTGDKVYLGKTMTTVSCPQLRPYYDLFYPAPERIRVFPGDLHCRMTPLVLAVWFMDDGSLTNRGAPRISFGLDAVSLKRALKALRKLGLKPTVYGEPGGQSIEFPKQAVDFKGLVEPYIVPCLSYKVPTESDGQAVHRRARSVSPEKIRTLYEGGLTSAGIAKLYNIGQTTVNRRLISLGVEKRTSGPRKMGLSLNAAQELLQGYHPKEWFTMDADAQEQWITDILGILRKAPFPDPVLLTPEEALEQFQRVREAGMIRQGDEIRPMQKDGIRLCTSQFPNRYRAKSRTLRSAYEAWFNDKELRTAVRLQLKYGDPVIPSRVLRAVTMRCRTPSVFRPTVARFIYQEFCPAGGKVWDPCAGYGGRLLGALAAGVQYVGTDVDEETIRGNEQLASLLGMAAELHCCPAEEFTSSAVDLVFTSPPYFDQERYSEAASQSWQRYDTLDAWLEGFLRPVVRSAAVVSPRLVLNVANVRGLPLVDSVLRVAGEEGWVHRETLKMPLARLNRENPSEPVLVFTK